MPEILGSKVDNVTMQQALERIEVFIRDKSFAHIVTLNAEIAWLAHSDEKLRRVINDAALVTPDGSGIVWAAEQLGCPLPERVAGCDLAEQLCALAAQKGYKVFMLGAEQGVAEEAAQKLCAKYPGLSICGCYHGFFLKEPDGTQKVYALLREAQPDILLVAMGAPKQEFVIEDMKGKLPSMVVMGVGGSFDVFAGRVKRAPVIVQKLHLEWLWRTVLQPSRWKRTMRLPLFMREVRRRAKAK